MSLTYRFLVRLGTLVLGAAVLTVPPAAIGTASAAAASHCVPTERPLGAATGYTEFIAGSGSRGSESEGAIAWGGNLNANGMTVGTRLNSAPTDPTLVVAGTHGTFNLQKGSAYVVPKTGVNFNGGQGTGYLDTNPIDFAGAFATLTSRSAAWGAAPPNGTAALGVVAGQNYLVLSGNDPTLNIFSLTPAQLTSGAGVAYDVPAGSTVLVNVAATSVALQGQMWIKQNGSYTQVQDNVMMSSWPGILWNFPNATSITMNVGSAWGGSILAPKANLQVSNVGHTIGQIITDRFSSNFETHQNNFPTTACLPPLAAASTPSIQLLKSASSVTDLDGNGTDAGDTLTYSFVVTNTGDVELTQIQVSDPLLGAVTCPAGPLAPGATASCGSKTYSITTADMAAGSRVNTATASGRTPGGDLVSDEDTVTTPLAPSKANLVVQKSVDDTTPTVGQTVTYTLVATNQGPAAATDVILSDALPDGVTFVSASSPCSHASGVVTCALGSLAAGDSVSVAIAATVDAVPVGADEVPHDLDVTKTEAQIDVEPNQASTVTVSCEPGFVVLDGAGRIDHVDQGTGTFGDVRVTESFASGPRSWTVTLKNAASGRAQGKAFAVCAKATTNTADAHSHPLLISDTLEQTVTLPNGAGTELSCGSGQVPVAPGFRLDAPANVLSSAPSGDRSWNFTVSGGSASQGTFSIRCLETTLGAASGHQHDLGLRLLRQSVVVPAGEVVEYQLTCTDNAKGIVAGQVLAPGLVDLGNDPRPKTRAYRIFNLTSGPLGADLSLLCLEARTAGAGTSRVVANTVSGSTSSPETRYDDNSATATFTSSPAPAAAPVVTIAGSAVAVRRSSVVTTLRCGAGRTTCAGTVVMVAAQNQRVAGKLIRRGTVLARSTYTLAPGKRAAVTLRATKVGKPVIRSNSFKRAQLRVGSTKKVVSVRR